MRSIKTYLFVVVGLLIIALGFVVYIWLQLQSLQRIDTTAVDDVPQTTEETTKESVVLPPDSPSEQKDSITSTIDEPITVDSNSLTDSQNKILDTVGIDVNAITITKDMVSCAENELGTARLEEIMGGAAPGPLEALKLLGCFKE